MKVLFVYSGNAATDDGITPIVKNQALFLIEAGCDLSFFPIKGKGIVSYIKAIPQLKKHLKKENPSIIHAHYSLSGFVASLSGAKNVICSLMGSDVKSDKTFKRLILYFAKNRWKLTLVKSQDMKASLGYDKAVVIPNGVNTSLYQSLDKEECKKALGWDVEKKQVLFAANPSRREKNFSFAQEVFNDERLTDIELKVLDNVPSSEMPLYHNAADVVILTSLWEGSPNVIKEALACSRPIVSTNVGDVAWLIKGVAGCFVTDYDNNDFTEKILCSMAFEKTNGLDRINELGLSSALVAASLIMHYKVISDV